MNKKDRHLGMNANISRRDFLSGSSYVAGGAILGPGIAFAPSNSHAALADRQNRPGYYPPTLEGLRGSHPGSFEAAHLMRDGKRWDNPDDSQDTGEQYDLVVVGGGISGLASAWFYRREHPDASILILDNHDDFGGHAKRNEFQYKGKTIVDLGGTEFIETPSEYPVNAAYLMESLGVDFSEATKVYDHELYPSLGMRGSVFFDEATFGSNALVAGAPGSQHARRQYSYITLPPELELSAGDPEKVARFLEQTPLSEADRKVVQTLFCGGEDYLAGKSSHEKVAYLMSVSYTQFLQNDVKASQAVQDFFWMWRGSYMGNGVDLTPAYFAMRYGLPGTVGLEIDQELEKLPGYSGRDFYEDLHFPDGNASVARLIVRDLIPGITTGETMHDIVSARFDYGKLDHEESDVRIRLNSTAVNVRHVNESSVEVTYLEGEKAQRIRASNCVLACYHAIIPYICSELPAPQREALHKTIRMPLVSISVLLDNWQAFERLGIYSAYCPGSYCSDIRLTHPLKFDDYQSARAPADPTTVHMYRIPLSGKGKAGEQFRLGRYELLEASFETFERNIREQLNAMLSAGGFDAARDIQGISVNRWPHGYAVGYDAEQDTMNYWSESWPESKRQWLKGRQQFGRISIANTDAAASAMTETAIEQGFRATQELLKR